MIKQWKLTDGCVEYHGNGGFTWAGERANIIRAIVRAQEASSGRNATDKELCEVLDRVFKNSSLNGGLRQ